MGIFLERVRKEEIDGPLRRKFTPSKWKRAFEDSAPHDEADKRLHIAALVIHEKLQNIRSRLISSSTSNLSAAEKLRACVAASNYNFLVTRTKTQEAFQKIGAELADAERNEIRAEEIFSEIKLELPGGFDYSPDEIVESIVDGIEVPIKFALKDSPDLSGNPRMARVTWSDIVLELNLGIMFRQTEDLWDDCLWNGYSVHNSKLGKIFIPEDIKIKRGYALGIARRMSLATNFSIIGKRCHDEMMAKGYKPRIRDIVSIKKDGKRQTIKVSKTGDPTSEAQEDLFILRALANEKYYANLLNAPLPALKGVTLSDVLNAWVVISRIAIVQLEMIAKNEEASVDTDAPNQSWLTEYLPILQIESLVQALSNAADIQPAVGRLIVDFFTYHGNNGQEIWAAPLVPVGPRSVAPVFAAVVSPNLRRLVDIWMRLGGIDLEVRGPAFEQYLRKRIQDSIAASPVLHNQAKSLPNGYMFGPSTGRSEEIDLLFIIGSTVFVGEAKCILEPTDAKGLSNHRRTVLGAAEQAIRKSRCLDNNKAEFINDVSRFGITLSEDFNVFPFIVVSTGTHVGTPADGVPVIDEYILTKFLEGELEHATVDASNFMIHQRTKDIFYTDIADAQAKALQYFTSPPQLKRLIAGLCGRVIPIHAIDEKDWEGFVISVECEPRQETEPMEEAV